MLFVSDIKNVMHVMSEADWELETCQSTHETQRKRHPLTEDTVRTIDQTNSFCTKLWHTNQRSLTQLANNNRQMLNTHQFA